MKRCPTCQKTFDDSLRFCQLDGTPLVDEIGSVAGSNPLETMVGAAPINDDEDDLLQLGGGAKDDADDVTKTLISNPDSRSAKSPLDEFTSKSPSPFDEFSSTSSATNSNSFSDEKNSSNSSPFGSPDFQSSPSSPFSEPPPTRAPEMPFNQNSFNSGQNQYGQPLQQSSWTPPPAPEANWQSQNIGANTPFQPPMIIQGQNQTLPIISLVLGIISALCCWVGFLTGPAALITGYLGKKNADSNPNEFGGGGMALAGMITGGIGTLISIGYFIVIIIGLIASPR